MKKSKKLAKRAFGIVAVEVVLSNPNGNPDEDDMPRLTNDECGLITPVCFKHRTRELLEDHEGVTWEYLQGKLGLDDDSFHIWESACKGYDVNSPIEAKEHWSKMVKEEGEESLLKRFWDMRVFGTTALETKGKDSLNFKRTGCVSVSPLVSLLPIEVINQTITKGNPLESKLMAQGQGTIAPFGYKVVRHGLYIGVYVINPSKAHYTGTTEQDIDVFKELIKHSFSNSTAASRSGVRVVQIVHAEHDNPLGSFNESTLFEFCKPSTDLTLPSISMDDYNLKSLDDIKKAFPDIKVEMLSNTYSEALV